MPKNQSVCRFFFFLFYEIIRIFRLFFWANISSVFKDFSNMFCSLYSILCEMYFISCNLTNIFLSAYLYSIRKGHHYDNNNKKIISLKL